MHAISFAAAGAAVIFVIVGTQVIRARAGSLVNRLFGACCLLFALWSASLAFLVTSDTQSQAWFWYHLSVAGWTLTPALLLHFFLLLTERRGLLASPWLHGLAYAPALVFFARALTGVATAQDLVVSRWGWTEVPSMGAWSMAYNGYYLAYVAAGLLAVHGWGKARLMPLRGEQARLIITTGIVAVGLATLTNRVLPASGAMVPAMAPVFLLIWVGGIWYAMTRHSLMMMTPAVAAEEILSTMSDGVLLAGPDNIIIRANGAAARLLEADQLRLAGRNVKEVLPGKDVSATQVLGQIGPGKGDLFQETSIITRSNRELPLAISTSTVRDRRGQVIGVVTILRDISEQKRLEEQLRSAAQHDTLTGLPNRSLLADRLQQTMARARRYQQHVALFMLDLDHFKNVNDRFGHDHGDEVLRLAAKRLSGCVRGHDTVARLGGDEFVIVAGELPLPRTAEVIATRVIAAFGLPLQVKEQTLQITPSIGIAVWPGDAEQTEELFKRADIALYVSKKRSRNTYTFFEAGMAGEAGVAGP